MKKSIVLVTLFVTEIAFGQLEYQGVLLDATTLKPIPYVNLSWSYSKKGSISNENGEYKIVRKDTKDHFPVTISHLGYHKTILEWNALRDTIYLSPRTIRLNEVIVVDIDDLKKKVLLKFEKNYGVKDKCESFFVKQFLKKMGATLTI